MPLDDVLRKRRLLPVVDSAGQLLAPDIPPSTKKAATPTIDTDIVEQIVAAYTQDIQDIEQLQSEILQDNSDVPALTGYVQMLDSMYPTVKSDGSILSYSPPSIQDVEKVENSIFPSMGDPRALMLSELRAMKFEVETALQGVKSLLSPELQDTFYSVGASGVHPAQAALYAADREHHAQLQGMLDNIRKNQPSPLEDCLFTSLRAMALKGAMRAEARTGPEFRAAIQHTLKLLYMVRTALLLSSIDLRIDWAKALQRSRAYLNKALAYMAQNISDQMAAAGLRMLEQPVLDVFNQISELEALGVECPAVNEMIHNALEQVAKKQSDLLGRLMTRKAAQAGLFNLRYDMLDVVDKHSKNLKYLEALDSVIASLRAIANDPSIFQRGIADAIDQMEYSIRKPKELRWVERWEKQQKQEQSVPQMPHQPVPATDPNTT